MLTRTARTAQASFSLLSGAFEIALLRGSARCWPAVARVMSPEPGFEDLDEIRESALRPFRDPLI